MVDMHPLARRQYPGRHDMRRSGCSEAFGGRGRHAAGYLRSHPATHGEMGGEIYRLSRVEAQ
jgi:hypothetical protein